MNIACGTVTYTHPRSGRVRGMKEPGLQETPRVPAALPETTSTIDARSLPTRTPEVLESPAWLLLFRGDTTRMVPLPANGEFTIGRAEGCDLRLDEHRVSRTHARLTMLNGQARLADLGSQNGSLLNEEPLVGQRVLGSGDVITIAGVTLVFHTSSRGPRASGVLESAAFKARSDVELERATRFSRPLTMVDLHFVPAPDRALLQPRLESSLRKVDLAAWTASDHLTVLLPEADQVQGRELAEQLVDVVSTQHPGVRAGLAVYPDDGVDAETLQAAARAASAASKPGEVALAAETFRVMKVGERAVLVADAVMVRVYELVQRLARSDLSVLVHGETGAGKELVAAALHEFSTRVDKRFLAVNCAAFQESLLESELFGHEKGAFTGAVATKIGLLEAAAGGTVFLDEVGEMSTALQARLLRALETRRITRVGDTREREVGFRVVAATHRDLEAEVRAGRFREDLYFRLSGATVWLPPLRDRKRELPMLARRFLDEACARAGRAAPVLAGEALQVLAEHPWPGNVRELKNVMEYAAATVQEPVVERWHLEPRLGGQRTTTAQTSPAGPATPVTDTPRNFRPLADEVRELERKRMLEALEACGWNQTRAANSIEMPLRTFVTKAKQFDLQKQRAR